jgi:hypothetical protein
MLLLHAKWRPAGTFVFPPAPPLGASSYSVLPGLRGATRVFPVEVDFDDRVTDLIADGY